MSNDQSGQNEGRQESARASKQRAVQTIWRFFFASGWIFLAIELFYLYRDVDFGAFDLFLASVSALCFLSAWQFRARVRRQPGASSYHPLMIPSVLLFLVMLIALGMSLFG